MTDNTQVEREIAAELEQRANNLVSDQSLHRVIHATDHGWVEIQADFLDALIAQAEAIREEPT